VKKVDIKEQFGAKVKDLRKLNMITQADLAAAVDIDIRTIRRIESGTYNPTLEIIGALAQAFKISVSDLFK
jgi:DNA-binding XRE family transcriptional regulator